ncbi:MAG: hypothetical protein WDW38_009394 [Sanguina aurantia]
MVDEHKLPAYKAINPLCTLPSYRDSPDSIIITESGAIVQFILAKYGKGRLEPTPGTLEHASYLQWFWFAEGTAMPALSKWADHSMMLPYNKQVSWIAEGARGQVSAHLALYEAHFAKTGCKYLAGDELTAADIMNSNVLFMVGRCELADEDQYPLLNAYCRLLATHASYKSAFDNDSGDHDSDEDALAGEMRRMAAFGEMMEKADRVGEELKAAAEAEAVAKAAAAAAKADPAADEQVYVSCADALAEEMQAMGDFERMMMAADAEDEQAGAAEEPDGGSALAEEMARMGDFNRMMMQCDADDAAAAKAAAHAAKATV